MKAGIINNGRKPIKVSSAFAKKYNQHHFHFHLDRPKQQQFEVAKTGESWQVGCAICMLLMNL